MLRGYSAVFSEHFVIQPNIKEKHFHLDAPINTI